LRIDADTAEHDGRSQRQQATIVANAVGDLRGEFARRRYYQRAQWPAAIFRRLDLSQAL